MVLEARQQLLDARLAGDAQWAAELEKDLRALHAAINTRIDRATAYVLHVRAGGAKEGRGRGVRACLRVRA